MFHRTLFSLSLLSLSVAVAQVQAADALNTPRLKGIDNFRDVAGTSSAYQAAHDGSLRAGQFYRSNALTPTAADLKILNGLGLSNVYDLRTPS